MVSSVALYEELTNAPDERTRMRLLAEALERLEHHRPLPEGLATTQQLSETELRLRKEIEQLRNDTEGLRKDSEGLRKETEELRKEVQQLRKEVEQLRHETEKVRAEIAYAKADAVKWIAGLLVVQGAAIVGAMAALV